MQNLILERFKKINHNMENPQFILKNRDKSIPIVTYSALAFFLFIIIRNNLQPEIYLKDTTVIERILFSFLMLSMLFVFLYFVMK